MTRAKTHPGVVLKEEFLWPLGISTRALAEALEIPATLMAGIVEGRSRVTEDTALRLSERFGGSAVFWLGLQADYDVTRSNELRRLLRPNQIALSLEER